MWMSNGDVFQQLSCACAGGNGSLYLEFTVSEPMTKEKIIDPVNSLLFCGQAALHVLAIILPPKSLETHIELPFGIRSSKS